VERGRRRVRERRVRACMLGESVGDVYGVLMVLTMAAMKWVR
jgi:hypothetical protein